MRYRAVTIAAAAATTALTLLAAGCGGSSASSGGTTTGSTANAGSAPKTVTVGVLTDVTGIASSANKTFVDGVKAGTYLASRDGYKIKYVVGDTATNPTTALAAAQKLVTQDHALVVLADSSLLFAAAGYLTAHNVPVIGISADGPEWISAKNMFSVAGPLQQTKVSTTLGKIFTQLGVTNLASVGYSVSPVSAEAASSTALSAQLAGIRIGYLNAKLPFGTTDVGPTVLAMKSAGINGLYSPVAPDTSFALISGLRDQGVTLTGAVLPAGYGGDMLQAGAGAIAKAQGAYFTVAVEPVEMGTAATKQLQADFTSAGMSTEPTYGSYVGYMSIGLLVRALRDVAGNATQASLITALSNIHDWDAMGLFGGHKLDINDRENIVNGVDNCLWVTKLEGDKFVLVPGADPVCGALVPGKTVSPAS
jgi:ABC-type branched-subunit amino acid transport system substrate-binding protein